MIKYGFALLCVSFTFFAMETPAQQPLMQQGMYLNIYKRAILPYMPADTKVTEKKAVTILQRLAQTSFEDENSEWTFQATFVWMTLRKNEEEAQDAIQVLKRYIAAIINKADDMSDLCKLRKTIAENNDSLRWVVTGDCNSGDSDNAIKNRWLEFIDLVSESAS